MGRREPVTFYVSESEKEEIKQEANDADKTVSNYTRDLVQQKRRENAQEEAEGRLNAEKRIEELLVNGTDELEDIADDIRQQNQQVMDALDELYAVEIARLEQEQDQGEGETTDSDADPDAENGSLADRVRGDNSDS